MNASLNERLRTVKWGEYRIDDLFLPQTVKHKLCKEDLSDDFNYPAYSSEVENSGIVGHTNKPEFICNKETPIYVLFGDHTRTLNIAEKSFSVLDNVKVLVPKINNIKVLLFIFAIWKKHIPNHGYTRHWKNAKDCILMLPINNDNKLNIDFIESFIAELEAERVAELSAYLTVSGLDNYELSSEEEKAVEGYYNSTFKEYDLIRIFDVKNTLNILSSDIVKNSGTTPYLCASAENNAVSSYIKYDEKYIEKGNCIFIGGKTFVVTYQNSDFYSNDSHNLALYLKGQETTKPNQLYLATCLYKSLSYKYSWGDSVSKAKIKTDKIYLPTKDDKPDYDSMETLISAVQKLVIKDVVLYADKKITATKSVVEQ